jgi:hypothetical protein
VSKQEQFRWRILQTRDLLETEDPVDPVDPEHADPVDPVDVGPVVLAAPADADVDLVVPDVDVDLAAPVAVTRARTCTRT